MSVWTIYWIEWWQKLDMLWKIIQSSVIRTLAHFKQTVYSPSVTASLTFDNLQTLLLMNWSRKLASLSLAVNQSYSNLSIHSHSRMPHMPSEFHLQWVMECLVQIQSSIITIQYHFAYPQEIVAISFEWRKRRKISSINHYCHSYSSLSIHLIQ